VETAPGFSFCNIVVMANNSQQSYTPYAANMLQAVAWILNGAHTVRLFLPKM
jgi:hypothetical protein